MRDFTETKEKVIEAAAAMRDDALVKLGSAAATRRAQVRRRKVGRYAVGALVVGGALVASSWAVTILKAKYFAG